MEENLEVYFCEICSESVPAKDLETRVARQIKGKVVGACCLAEAMPQTGRSGAGGGLTTLGVVFLAGLAAATIWLEYRVTSVSTDLDGRLSDIRDDVAQQGGMWETLDGRLDKFADKASLAPMSTGVGRLETAVAGVKTLVDQLSDSQRGSKLQIENMDERLGKVRDQQDDAVARIKSLQSDLQRLAQDVAAIAALPRASAKPADSEHDVGSPVAKEAADKGGLPPALAHQVGRLKDEDAGNRFEAVDQLIGSKNAAVREHLIPMLKDPDLFVRRLTAEGLSKFKHKDSVDALLVALADPESIVRHTAYTSLKKLTGQKLPFDPDASGSARNGAQRVWKEWWKNARDTF